MRNVCMINVTDETGWVRTGKGLEAMNRNTALSGITDWFQLLSLSPCVRRRKFYVSKCLEITAFCTSHLQGFIDFSFICEELDMLRTYGCESLHTSIIVTLIASGNIVLFLRCLS